MIVFPLARSVGLRTSLPTADLPEAESLESMMILGKARTTDPDPAKTARAT
jgi:hypothetical protein